MTSRGRVLRGAWLGSATIMACIGLGVCLEAKDDGERYLNPTSLLLYLGVVMLLAAVAYAIHRVLVCEPPDTARRGAAIDALLVGVVTGPVLLLVVVMAATIRDCSFGTGC